MHTEMNPPPSTHTHTHTSTYIRIQSDRDNERERLGRGVEEGAREEGGIRKEGLWEERKKERGMDGQRDEYEY